MGQEAAQQRGAGSAAPWLCPVPAGTAHPVVLWSALISPGEAFTEPSRAGKERCSTHFALQTRHREDGKGEQLVPACHPMGALSSFRTADSFLTQLRENWCPCDGK